MAKNMKLKDERKGVKNKFSSSQSTNAKFDVMLKMMEKMVEKLTPPRVEPQPQIRNPNFRRPLTPIFAKEIKEILKINKKLDLLFQRILLVRRMWRSLRNKLISLISMKLKYIWPRRSMIDLLRFHQKETPPNWWWIQNCTNKVIRMQWLISRNSTFSGVGMS